MALPLLRVLFKGAQALQKYGAILPHIRNGRATAGFLGKSLKDLRKIWQDEDAGTLFTLYDSIEKLIEIKIFMHVTSANLGLETRGKPPAEVLHNIVDKLKAEGATGAVRQIEETLDWAAEFFQREDVQEIFKEANKEVKPPSLTKPKEYVEFVQSLLGRIGQESSRINKVMKAAKQPPQKKPGNDGP